MNEDNQDPVIKESLKGEKVKECPFCGKESKMFTETNKDKLSGHIYCEPCRVRMAVDWPNETNAILKWNQRQTEDALRKRVEILQEALYRSDSQGSTAASVLNHLDRRCNKLQDRVAALEKALREIAFKDGKYNSLGFTNKDIARQVLQDCEKKERDE